VIRYLLVGFQEALDMTLEMLAPLGPEAVPLEESVGRVTACAIAARVDSPSVNASLMDGFAVRSEDLLPALEDRPVHLQITGSLAAGDNTPQVVDAGTAVRVLTGAKMPLHADAVLPEEHVRVQGDQVVTTESAAHGSNILPRGCDVKAGQVVIGPGEYITPGQAGLLAASGHSEVSVIKNPAVSIIATGDEVVFPGKPLDEGKLYASNLVTLNAWCRRYGLKSRLAVIKDDPQALQDALEQAAARSDAIITSGGAWTSDRDMVVRVLERMNWRQVFHRIRIGPGKAVGFGLLGEKAVFILPGGPPSNLMGFLQIALPGLLRLAGHPRTGLPTALVELAADLEGRYADWTQFVFGLLENKNGKTVFHPLRMRSRLQSMADAQAIVAIPEGSTCLPTGEMVWAQRL
jgi:molybdopterin molybdotransferase